MTEEQRKHKREYDRRRYSDPEIKAKRAEYMRKYNATPEAKAKRTEYDRRRYQSDTEYRERRKAYIRDYRRERWANDPDFREKCNEASKKWRARTPDKQARYQENYWRRRLGLPTLTKD